MVIQYIAQIEQRDRSISVLVSRTNEIIILEVTLQLYLSIGVDPFAVHLVSQPLSSIVALVSPCISAFTLSVAILKLSLINISIDKYVQS